MGVKTHLSVNLPQSVSISGAEIKLTLRPVTTYVLCWLQAFLHWRCTYFQTLSWNDTIFVVDWDILYKLCGSANSGVKDLSSLVRYDDSCLAAIRHVQSIIPVVRPCQNKRSHSVLFNFCTRGDNINFVFQIQLIKGFVTWDKKNCFSGPTNHIFLCYVIFLIIDRLQIWRRKHKSEAYR